MIRAFLAVELPEGLKKSIAQIQDQVRGGIAKTVPPTTRLQWVRPDSMHLTLKFLGDIEEAQIESIKQALALPMTAFPGFPWKSTASESSLTLVCRACFGSASPKQWTVSPVISRGSCAWSRR